VDRLGVASFGPLVLDRQDPNYGRVAKTPKAGWSGADLVGVLQSGLGCAVSLDTDVNGAGLAEAMLGAGRGLDVVAYVTVGTGVGGGVIVRGQPLHGLNHPEMGHILLQKQPADADFAGVCPFHGHCVEGLTSGPAVLARLGHPLSEADPASPIFDLIGGYLGQFCATLSLIAAPQRIILGGGVMSNVCLYPKIRTAFSASLADYLQAPVVRDPQSYISPPALGGRAGVIGAMLLADCASVVS
jgi:fructokinase